MINCLGGTGEGESVATEKALTPSHLYTSGLT